MKPIELGSSVSADDLNGGREREVAIMRKVVTTLTIILMLGVCVWWTSKDSMRPVPGGDRVARHVPAVVAPEGGSAAVATPFAPTTVPRDKSATTAAVPTDQFFKISPVPPHKPAAPIFQLSPAVRKWLVGELVHEGLSEFDSGRIVRATIAKIAKCYKLYGRFPKRPDLHVCAQNAVQESGMSEALRRLVVAKKAADAAYRPPPDQAPPVPDAASRR